MPISEKNQPEKTIDAIRVGLTSSPTEAQALADADRPPCLDFLVPEADVAPDLSFLAWPLPPPVVPSHNSSKEDMCFVLLSGFQSGLFLLPANMKQNCGKHT